MGKGPLEGLHFCPGAPEFQVTPLSTDRSFHRKPNRQLTPNGLLLTYIPVTLDKSAEKTGTCDKWLENRATQFQPILT